MASKRDNPFPATSIGRTQGNRLQRVPSHELLAAHPLLSPTYPSELRHGSSVTSGSSSPKYVPYTPRQRVTPTATTTGTIAHPPSPHPNQGDATSKLQLMNLKAATQIFGLDTGSVGWAILERLVLETDNSTEWNEIWNAVATGKATLLLPLEQASSHDKITTDFVRDHIVIYDGPSRKNAQLVTLSGFRAVLDRHILTFQSSIHPSSRVFQDLFNSSTRALALAILPSLYISPSTSLSIPYPTFTVSSYTDSLPLPPRALAPTKPTLPPRPVNRPNSTPPVTTTRLHNPFASLFGGALTKTPASPTLSPPESLHTPDPQHDPPPVIDISAFTIAQKIDRKDLGRQINKALRSEAKESLASPLPSGGTVPLWVIDRVHEFTASWYPLVKATPSKKKSVIGDRGAQDGDNSLYVVNPVEVVPDNAAERLQNFYLALEKDLRTGGTSFFGKREDKDREKERETDVQQDTDDTSNEIEREQRVQEKMDSEMKIKEITEVVERIICSLFYDRLYMQPTSDDASHDEALSSRIAALNMLDLGLEHLDIYVGKAGMELDLVVKACGEMLTQLNACGSPGDKAAILVAAHKIVVDGLSRLPPIRLMSEEESKAQKAKQASSLAEAPGRSADGTLKILMPVEPDPVYIESPEIASQSPSQESSFPIPTVLIPESGSRTKLSPATAPPHVDLSLHLPPSSPSARSSPVLTMSPPVDSTPVSGDVLLPIIIFSVVKANPPHLVSNLLYTQRFRNQSVGGEESYCLINLMAVAEFLENVDLAALGLGDSDKLLSASELTPIPLNRTPIAESPLAQADGLPGSLRGRVEQANKVITDVVGSSFGMLRSFLPRTPDPITPEIDGVQGAAPWNTVKPGFGLLRRETALSIANIAASLPIRGGRSATRPVEETGQQLLPVSRPSSIKSNRRSKGDVEDSAGDDRDETGDEEQGADDEDGLEEDADEGVTDTRSIQSFESMLNGKGKGKGKGKERKGARARKSISDRLAHMSSLAGLKASPPTSHRSSLVPHTQPHRFDTPFSSRPGSPASMRLAPPIQRFLDCTPDDLRLSEVGELLRDYRRLAEGIRAAGGFDE